MIGPGINSLGEMKANTQIWQKQIAATVAELLDQQFEANHPVATAFNLPAHAYDQQKKILSLGWSFNFLFSTEGILIFIIFILLIKLFRKKRALKPVVLQQ